MLNLTLLRSSPSAHSLAVACAGSAARRLASPGCTRPGYRRPGRRCREHWPRRCDRSHRRLPGHRTQPGKPRRAPRRRGGPRAAPAVPPRLLRPRARPARAVPRAERRTHVQRRRALLEVCNDAPPMLAANLGFAQHGSQGLRLRHRRLHARRRRTDDVRQRHDRERAALRRTSRSRPRSRAFSRPRARWPSSAAA